MIGRASLAAVLALGLAACGESGEQEAPSGVPESNLSVSPGAPGEDLAGLLAAQPRLRALVEAAGMAPLLSGREPYTLLAPTDAALDRLGPAALERLSQPAQRAELTALLRHHIVPGTVLAADLARAVEQGGGTAPLATMAGTTLTVTREGEGLRIAGAGASGARFVGAEQPARNGAVHAIDALLMPPATGN